MGRAREEARPQSEQDVIYHLRLSHGRPRLYPLESYVYTFKALSSQNSFRPKGHGVQGRSPEVGWFLLAADSVLRSDFELNGHDGLVGLHPGQNRESRNSLFLGPRCPRASHGSGVGQALRQKPHEIRTTPANPQLACPAE